jgi:hypothetical protein
MVDDESAPRAPRGWPLGLVALGAAVVAAVAWVVREAVESANIPHDTGRQWPAFWATAIVGLAVLLVLANRRATPGRALASTATAAGVFMATLVVVVFVGLSTAGCGLSPDSASWTDPMLHEGLEGRHGLPVTTQPAAAGFGFRDADLDSRWPGYDLVRVAWGRGIGYDFGPVAIVAEPGMVWAAYLDLADFHGHRQELVEFLAGFGAPPQEAGRIVDAMEANATVGDAVTRWPYDRFVEFSAAIPVDWEPRVAWDSFCCIGQQPTDDASHGNELGVADLRVGQWNFVFSLATKHLEGEGFTIDTDAAGRVHFAGLAAEDEDAYKTKVRRTLGGLDLPQPGRDGMQLGGSIC